MISEDGAGRLGVFEAMQLWRSLTPAGREQARAASYADRCSWAIRLAARDLTTEYSERIEGNGASCYRTAYADTIEACAANWDYDQYNPRTAYPITI